MKHFVAVKSVALKSAMLINVDLKFGECNTRLVL